MDRGTVEFLVGLGVAAAFWLVPRDEVLARLRELRARSTNPEVTPDLVSDLFSTTETTAQLAQEFFRYPIAPAGDPKRAQLFSKLGAALSHPYSLAD
jgi:hypothetical protein